MYSCSAGEVVCARQAKSDDKSQLDEVIHSKHISNLLCVGSFFCSEFVVGASLLLSTWISSWMRATRRARSPSGPATASTISRQFLFYEDSNEVPSGCCGSRWHGEDDHGMGKTTMAAAAEVNPEDGSSSYIPGSSSCPSAQML